MRSTASVTLEDALPAAESRRPATGRMRWLQRAESPELTRESGERWLDAVERLMLELANPHPAEADVLGAVTLEHLRGGGKRLRARLALAACEALGGTAERSVGWAAACELLHNATLVHDDVQDGDRFRRGRPAVWARHGVAQAINAGDLLLMLPFLALEGSAATAQTRWRLARLLAGHAAAVVRGQAAELALSAAADADWQSYRAAVDGKTSALFVLPVEGAALLAGIDEPDARAIARSFGPLGVLFQLQDDLLDLYGDKGREEAGSDLRAGRVSALVVEHLALHPADRAWITGVLRAPRSRTTSAEVERAAVRFRERGAASAVLARAADEAEAALGSVALRRWPELALLAAELVEVMLAPIAPLRPTFEAAR